MLFFFITCFSFILFFKYSLPLKPHPCWVSEVRLISLCFLKDFSKLIPASKSFFKSIFTLSPSSKMSFKAKKTLPSNGFEQEDDVGLISKSVLDLPELALECILERLSPDGLCRMACVCTSLRDRCLSDHLWGGHMALKWGRIIGAAAHREWKWHISTRHIESNYLEAGKARGLIGYISRLWPVLLAKSNFIHYISDHNKRKIHSKVPADSIVACYRALQTGKFWFPAQVYNRENGHVGFMLSCYDAELSYDSRTDTFHARYPPHGRTAVAIESGVTWDRLRAPPIDTSPHDLHISDCLNELCPKDHIEIQWRRNKQFPYGWWYGVVGHLETCDGNDTYCRCHESDIVVLEFSQYVPGSRWRHMIINRKDHREEGNEADGFYGGIRKLYGPDEISTWKQFWPSETLE